MLGEAKPAANVSPTASIRDSRITVAEYGAGCQLNVEPGIVATDRTMSAEPVPVRAASSCGIP